MSRDGIATGGKFNIKVLASYKTILEGNIIKAITHISSGAIVDVPQGYGQACRSARADHNVPMDEEGFIQVPGTFVAAPNVKY